MVTKVSRSVAQFRGVRAARPSAPATIPVLGSTASDKAAWALPVGLLVVMVGGAVALTRAERGRSTAMAEAKSRGYGYYHPT